MTDETYTATTDENGVATFEDLPPGEYEVASVTPPGGETVAPEESDLEFEWGEP